MGVWFSFGIDYSFPKLCTSFWHVKIPKSILIFRPFSPNFSAFWDNLETYLELEHLINPCP